MRKTATSPLKRCSWGPLCLAIACLATPAPAAGEPAGQLTENYPERVCELTTGGHGTGLGVPLTILPVRYNPKK